MNAPIIDTPDFTLRPFQAADASAVASKIANWDVIRMLTTPPFPYRRQDAVNHIERVKDDAWHWVIDIDGPAGSIAVGSSLGYWLAKPHWGKGIMTRAAAKVLDLYFESTDHDAVRSGYLSDNAASARVQAKLGFAVDGNGQVRANSRDGLVDHVDTVLSRAAWDRSRSTISGERTDAEDP